MILSRRFSAVPPRSLHRHSLLVAAVLLAAYGSMGCAQGTKLWTQSRPDEFEKGTPQGVEIASDGKLRAGPVASEILTTPSSFVWSIAAGKAQANGEPVAYLGTASPAAVLRVAGDSAGKTQSIKIFETKALAVQVVRLGPDGALYAATIPDGKVYRLNPNAAAAVDESAAEVVFDLNKLDPNKAGDSEAAKAGANSSESKSPENKAHYIWDMTFDSAGRLYIATGGPAAIYRLDLAKASAGSHPVAEPFFSSDEQHIRALAWDKSGNLIAGTDGSGLIYRIDPAGKAYVLFSAPRREVTSVAVGADGVIYEADVGDKSHNPLPQLPVQTGQAGITITFVQPGSLQAANASTALPEGTEIYALKPNEAPRRIWSDKDAIVYQLAATGGELTALTGNRGRIFTLRPDGAFSDIAHLDAQQAVALAATPGGWLVATANTGKLYRLSEASSGSATPAAGQDRHAYASDVLDAGALARWGRVEQDPESHGFELWTRSGNVEQPVRREKDWGWSDWQPVSNGKIVSPPGRYLQWKVALGADGEIGGVGVNYLPVNSAPQIDDIVVVPGARATAQSQPAGQPGTVQIAFPSAAANAGAVFDANAANAAAPLQAQKDRTAVTARWAAHDDDGDDLAFDLYLRGDGEQAWLPLKKGLTDKFLSFDATELPDGGYTLRVVATDAPSHPPGDALTAQMTSERFELDTTPPVIANLKAQPPALQPPPSSCKAPACAPRLSIAVAFDARDATSPIGHAEYSLDAGPWQYIDPVGQLSDSQQEHYEFTVPLPQSTNATPADTSGLPQEHAQELAQEHLIAVRAYDRHENMATARTIVPPPTPKPGEK